MNDRPVFYYDFNSPYAWLAAERVNSMLPVPPVWQPISFGHILQASGREPWSFHEPTKSEGIAEVERRAAERGLPKPTTRLGRSAIARLADGRVDFDGPLSLGRSLLRLLAIDPVPVSRRTRERAREDSAA